MHRQAHSTAHKNLWWDWTWSRSCYSTGLLPDSQSTESVFVYRSICTLICLRNISSCRSSVTFKLVITWAKGCKGRIQIRHIVQNINCFGKGFGFFKGEKSHTLFQLSVFHGFSVHWLLGCWWREYSPHSCWTALMETSLMWVAKRHALVVGHLASAAVMPLNSFKLWGHYPGPQGPHGGPGW